MIATFDVNRSPSNCLASSIGLEHLAGRPAGRSTREQCRATNAPLAATNHRPPDPSTIQTRQADPKTASGQLEDPKFAYASREPRRAPATPPAPEHLRALLRAYPSGRNAALLNQLAERRLDYQVFYLSDERDQLPVDRTERSHAPERLEPESGAPGKVVSDSSSWNELQMMIIMTGPRRVAAGLAHAPRREGGPRPAPKQAPA